MYEAIGQEMRMESFVLTLLFETDWVGDAAIELLNTGPEVADDSVVNEVDEVTLVETDEFVKGAKVVEINGLVLVGVILVDSVMVDEEIKIPSLVTFAIQSR